MSIIYDNILNGVALLQSRFTPRNGRFFHVSNRLVEQMVHLVITISINPHSLSHFLPLDAGDFINLASVCLCV